MSVPDKPEGQAQQQAGNAAADGSAEQGRDRCESQNHQREIFGRAKQQRELDEERRQERQRQGSQRAGDERADGRRRKRRRARALAAP